MNLGRLALISRWISLGQILFLCFTCSVGEAQTLNDTLDSPLDGQVNCVVVSGNKIYFGGNFTKIGYSTGTGALLDTGTAVPDRTFPKFDPMGNLVLTSVADGSGGLYVGGQFLYINGVPRKYLAHVRADRSLDSWNPAPNSFVETMSVAGNRLYVGGVFDSIAGQARGHAAAFNISDGSLLSWDPQADNEVTALQQMGAYVYIGGYFTGLHSQLHLTIGSVDTTAGNPTNWSFYNTVPSGSGHISCFVYAGGYLYAAGLFSMIDSVNRNGLIKFDQAGNVVTGWNPGATMSGGGGYASVLAVSGSNVFVGGSFTSIGGSSVSNLAAIDTGTGLASSWNPNPNNNVTALAVSGTKLFVGGNFTSIGGRSINNLAAVDMTTGNASTWDAKLYNYPSTVNVWTITPVGTSIFTGGFFIAAGQTTRNGLASIDFSTGRVTSWNPNVTGGPVNAIASAGDKIIAGGSFTFVGGLYSISNLAAFDTLNGSPELSPNWLGTASSAVYALEVLGDRLYLGGNFTAVNSTSRSYVAALNKRDGSLLSWHPVLNSGGVYSLASSGSKIFLSGFFTQIGSASRQYAAAFDTVTDTLTSWNPGPDNICMSLAAQNGKVYLGGEIFNVDGQSMKSIAAVDTATGALVPGFNANFTLAFTVDAIAVADTHLVIGGNFSSSYPPHRSALAYLNANTGSTNSFNAHENNDVGSGNVNALAIANHMFVVGGQFVALNYFPQSNLAVYSDSSINPSGDIPLDVEATDFEAKSDGGSVILSWRAQSEIDIAGYNILREDPGTEVFKIISGYLNNYHLKSDGASIGGRGYDYSDLRVVAGRTYVYEIQSVSLNGNAKVLATLSTTIGDPKAYALYQNYPNPFNPSTTIRFDLKEQSTVTLDIYNVLGQRVIENNYWTMNAGRYNENINMDRFASGVYLYRIAAQGNDGQKFVSIRKLVLMK